MQVIFLISEIFFILLFFRNFNFTATVQADNLLLFNATAKQNPQIFATAYGSGTATIQGTEQLINFDINMMSNPGTAISLNFMEGGKASEYDFISFVKKDTTRFETGENTAEKEKKQKERNEAIYSLPTLK